MITPDYLRHMARYNRWQNTSLFEAANTLDDAARKEDRGAFFGSIHGTLSHLLWGDTIWMSRFDGGAPPQAAISESANWIADWDALVARRTAMDARILDWANQTTQGDIDGELSWYSGAVERDVHQLKSVCLMQLFNHQTHHRGQVNAMLTAAGAKSHTTDLPFMPDDA